jgi:hypothetical protein
MRSAISEPGVEVVTPFGRAKVRPVLELAPFEASPALDEPGIGAQLHAQQLRDDVAGLLCPFQRRADHLGYRPLAKTAAELLGVPPPQAAQREPW